MDDMQLSLFDFDDIRPQKKESEIKPFFLVTNGMAIDRLKYGTSKEQNLLTLKIDTVEEIKEFLSRIIGLEESEKMIQKAIENQEEWYIYKDNSMYIF